MAHRNRNKNERKAAKAYAVEHGVSYQTAVQRLRNRHGVARALMLADVENTLDEAARRDLEELVRSAVARGIEMDEFSPFDYVEGDIEEATLVDFSPQDADLEEVELVSESGQAPRHGVHLRIEGDGDVNWFVSHATPGDVEAFGDAVEGGEDGPGFFQQHEGAVPVRLSVYAEWTPRERQWAEVSVQYVAMPDAELESRARRHSDEEFKRLQRLGLMPDDDEIEAMVLEHQDRPKQDVG